jgi:hypothetical protein
LKPIANGTVPLERGHRVVDRGVDAGPHLDALGVAPEQPAGVVEPLEPLDVPALELDPLVPDAQVRVVRRVLGQRVDDVLQLGERGVREVRERPVPPQEGELVLDAEPHAVGISHHGSSAR